MIKKVLCNTENQKGEVMIEASIILVSVILLLLVLLSLAFMFYQQALMTNVANEVAAKIAKDFKYSAKVMGTHTINNSDVEGVKMFRMSFAKNSVAEAHAERAKPYATSRFNMATLGINSGELNVICDVESSGIGRAYVKVTVSQNTDFFLSDVLTLAGIIDENNVFSATAYAECVDLMGYTSMVNFTDFGCRKLAVLNSVGNLYTSVKGFIQNLLD